MPVKINEFKIQTNEMPDHVHAYMSLGGLNLVSMSWRPSPYEHSQFIITEEAFRAIAEAIRVSKKEGRIVLINDIVVPKEKELQNADAG